jgi:hypothetical protein
MHGWLGIALIAVGVAVIALGAVKRRQRRNRVLPPGSIRPEYAGMSAIVRPLLLWFLGLIAAETCVHYFMFGGRALMAPLDFAGLLFLIAAFAAYVVLAVTKPVQAGETRP